MLPTQERIRELLTYNPETGVFTWAVNRKGGAKAGDRAGRVRSDGYREIRVDGGFYQASRLAIIYTDGQFNCALEVDHINRVKDDDRRCNLRLVTPQQNKQNIGASRNTLSGLLGVSWLPSKRRWLARICHEGKRKYLGIFKTSEEAHAAYVKAKRELHKFGTL